jgi:hypothetical protein
MWVTEKALLNKLHTDKQTNKQELQLHYVLPRQITMAFVWCTVVRSKEVPVVYHSDNYHVTTPTPHGTSLNCDIRNNKVLTFCSDKDLQLPGYYPAILWMALKHAMMFLHTITCITTASQPQCYANRTFHGVVLKRSQISLLITTNWFLFGRQLRSGGQKSKYL